MRAVALLLAALSGSAAALQFGTGIYDITGPAADVNLMGYAAPEQTAQGIHFRLRARAFVAHDPETEKRIAFVSADTGMGSDLVNMRVVEKLTEKLGSAYYTIDNLCISGTHTHSTPAGFLQYVLFQVTSWGFVQESFDALVDGIVEAVAAAHTNLKDGAMHANVGEVDDANINRSPTAYDRNPDDEKAQYKYNTDHDMTLLKITDGDGVGMGQFNWFAVHGTSMNNTNRLLSGDNRGYASYLFEREINGPTETVAPGHGDFVAAFASTNLGDVSPNTMGAKCLDTGLPCDAITSTCDGRNEMCVAFGPGTNGDNMESTEIIATKQYDVAKTLYDTAETQGTAVEGPVDYRHMFVHMPTYNVSLPDSAGEATLCPPAMGYAFAAGTTDGPGMFDFTQGDNSSNPFWNAIAGLLSKPTDEEIACQSPKPILLNTGDIDDPYEWDPAIVPVQILRVGQVFILAVPSEFTTMAGRRLRDAVKAQLVADGAVASADEAIVVISGLSNTYSSYTTTYEEYQAQRYEGASTVYGPNTHRAYVELFEGLASALAKGESVDPGPSPPDLTDKQISLLPSVILDGVAVESGKWYGDIETDLNGGSFKNDGSAEATVTFNSACPRNDRKTQGSFLTVERKVADATSSEWMGTAPFCAAHVKDCAEAGLVYVQSSDSGDGHSCMTGMKVQCDNSQWVTVATDGDVETVFHWYRSSVASDRSYAEVKWKVPAGTPAGTYRISHSGTYLDGLDRKYYDFTGASEAFTVVGA
mmetsp:Transcript_83783/g.236710  ORF Transcript_83783/g.236710 Transcript_83783/m.236710 type:complete len:758 (+) Transcript_83783:84-2357(+)